MSPTNLQGEIVLRHIERFLRSPEKVWRQQKDGRPLPFQVLLFKDQPEKNAVCLVTYGLSAHLLVNGKGEGVRMEYLIATHRNFDTQALSALLIAVGTDAAARHYSPGIHDVLPGSGAVLSNPMFEHLYLTNPGHFPKEFDTCKDVNPAVTIAQLVPLSANERTFIGEKGWRVFEDLLVKGAIDILEFDQRGVIL